MFINQSKGLNFINSIAHLKFQLMVLYHSIVKAY